MNSSLELYLLSIDEGISGYRDHSLEEVKFHSETYGLHLKILSYKGTTRSPLGLNQESTDRSTD